jgi:two-component system, cell cycle sensor histidine kinase and response regulator CckA
VQSSAPIDHARKKNMKNKKAIKKTSQSISKRTASNDVLIASEVRYRRLFETAQDGILILDAETGMIMDVNPFLLEMLGYSHEHFLKKKVWELGFFRDIIGNRKNFLELQRKKYVRYEDKPLETSDGRRIDVEFVSNVYEVDHQQVIQCNIRDITDRKKAEDALRESEQRLKLFVEHSPAAIAMFNNEMKYLIVSRRWYRDYGLLGKDIIGQSHYDVFPEIDERWKEIHRRCLAGATEYCEEDPFPRVDGHTDWVRWEIHPWRNARNEIGGIIIFSEVITDRKNAEEALRHAQKQESIGILAGGIAHDFNNLLQAVLGQISLALGKLAPENIAVLNLTKAIKAAEHAADLTRQLLAYAGKGKFLNSVIDLNRLINENIQMLETSVPRTARLRFELGNPSPHIRGDIGQLQQIIMNLIINAGESMGPKSGYITVRTRRIELTENDAEYWKYTNNPLPPGMYALLQVNDTGEGIKPEMLTRIFDPFFTTKLTGRGLGLAAVLGIIRGHHGGIHIESEMGQGTEFQIIFPLVEASKLANAQKMIASTAINGDGKTVVVIDDESSVLELLTDTFTDANFKVIGALNPTEGVELYREHFRNVAVVVMDYSMPGMDGKAAFNELVKINKDVIVVLCSGYMEDEVMSVFGKSHPHSFIQKPYKPNDLLEKVWDILIGGNTGK